MRPVTPSRTSATPAVRPRPSRPSRPPSGAEVAALHVRRMIFEGRLRPGDRVPQDAVAAELGISRIPLREALIALEREGWVRLEAHRGAFVTPLDADGVRDHYHLYGITYGFAAARAVERAPAGLADRLDALARVVETTDDPVGLQEAVVAFHAAVVEAAGSRPVRVALRASPPLVPGSFFEVVPEAVEVERRGVRAVVERVRAGDGPGAEAAYRAMMREQADLAVAALRRRGVI
nr:GntR family transcriptional regulator [Thermoanaerobacterales bacterium]